MVCFNMLCSYIDERKRERDEGREEYCSCTEKREGNNGTVGG